MDDAPTRWECAEAVLAGTPPVGPDPRLAEAGDWDDADRGLPAGRRRLMCLRLHAALARDESPFRQPARVLRALGGRDVPWIRDDLVWSLRILAGGRAMEIAAAYRLPLIITAALPDAVVRDLVPVLAAVRDGARDSGLPARHRHDLAARYDAQVTRLRAAGPCGPPPGGGPR